MMSKEEVMAWHANHDNFKNMKIDLNGDDVSDVIFHDVSTYSNGPKGPNYKNANTGNCGDYLKDVTRDGKKFIIFQSFGVELLKDLDVKGLYVKANSELDILIFVSVVLKKGYDGNIYWEEKERAFVSKSYEPCGNIVFSNFMFDICSQSLFVEDESDYLNTLNAMQLEALSYFGNMNFTVSATTLKGRNYFTFDTLSHFEAILNHYKNLYEVEWYQSIECGFINKHEGNKAFLTDRTEIEIPAAAAEAMNKLAESALDNMWKICREEKFRYQIIRSEFAILQKVGKSMVLRIFDTVFDYSLRKEDTKFYFYEIERAVFNKRLSTPKRYKDTPLIWCDDTAGTVFEFTADILHDAIDMYWDAIKNQDFLFNMQKVSVESFKIKYYVESKFAQRIASVIANNELLVKLHNLNCDGILEYKQRICPVIVNMPGILTETISAIFGTIDYREPKLHQMLYIPKGMLEYAIKMKDIDFIGEAKNAFSEDAASEYLSRMSRDEFVKLYDGMCGKNHGSKKIFKKLISIYGPASWKAYLTFISKLSPDYINMYEDYINRVSSLGEAAKKAQWKLTGEALERGFASLEAAEILKIKDSDGQITANYKKLGERWKDYEFHDENLMITYPKSPEDVILEGIILNHCAKEFVVKIGQGYTDILFIRQKNNPSKPYYTLEIRNGEIRQCHGHNNLNATEEIQEFLKKFCIQKNIIFSVGISTLGVN